MTSEMHGCGLQWARIYKASAGPKILSAVQTKKMFAIDLEV